MKQAIPPGFVKLQLHFGDWQAGDLVLNRLKTRLYAVLSFNRTLLHGHWYINIQYIDNGEENRLYEHEIPDKRLVYRFIGAATDD